MQAVGYEFDNDEYHRFVHGRLPYENLKPDPVLRNLLLTLPLRKLVCNITFSLLKFIFCTCRLMGYVFLFIRFSQMEMKFM